MNPEPAQHERGDPRGVVAALLEQVDSVGVAILVSRSSERNETERWVFASQGACKLLGCDPSQVLGHPVRLGRLPNATLRELSSGDLSDLDARGGRVFELLRKDGSSASVILRACDVDPCDGSLYRVHLIRSVAIEPRAMGAIRQSELRFRRLMDVAPDGMLVVVGHRIVYANEAITRLCGYSHPRQLAQLGLGHLMSKDMGPLLAKHIDQLREGQASGPFELQVLRRDETTALVEVHALRTDWDGDLAVLLTLRDLSGRRHLQSELVHSDRLAAVGTLAAGVAHEINNPLAYVLLNLQYLIREIPRVSEYFERIGHLSERLREARHGAERVAAIVKDLRTFSKADDETLGPVDLRRVLSSAIKVARSQLQGRGQIIEAFSEIPAAMGHASRLEQVFLNLLINAIQALSTDRSSENEIRVRTFLEVRAGLTYVTTEVTDNGLGIAPEILDRVFDPFFTTKPIGLGTGLGLPICHSIVTRMGGTIQVTSHANEGTSFFVSLPAALSLRPRLTPYPMTVLSREDPRAKILVVDDEWAVATMLSRVLDEEHDVLVATSGREALQLLEQQPFDVIFCDLLMPAMSGMDLYLEVRQRFPGQETAIAFMTGGAFTPRAAQFLSRVQNLRLEKPFDLAAVRSIVRELTSRRLPRS